MKIGVISDLDPFSQASWSGIIFNIADELKKENDVVWINTKPVFLLNIIVLFYKLIYKLYASITHKAYI